MKSYALAVALAMLLAATYAFQNTGEILVRFLIWERTIPQGIWDVLLFAAGGVLMWLVSLFALLETRGKYVRQIREKDKRIRELEEERASLMAAFRTRPRPSEATEENRVSGPGDEKPPVPSQPPEEPVSEEGFETEDEDKTLLDEKLRSFEQEGPEPEEAEDFSGEQDDDTKGV
ncbi:MAG: LapA family protein [Thermovirgaceae bacterium]